MIKLLVGALLALTTANVLAGNIYIYKDKGGQELISNVRTSGSFDEFPKKVKVTYYRDIKANVDNKSNQKQAYLQEKNISFGTSSIINSASSSNSPYDGASDSHSAYDALR